MQGGANPFSQMLMSMLGGGAGMGGSTGGRPPIPGQMSTPGGMSFTPPSMLDPALYSAAGYSPAMIDPSGIGSQGFNTGQDALMQMINRGIPTQQDPMVALGLQQAGQQFNNSDLFGALAPLDQRLIDQQAAQLQGSAGSLGARFGTAMMEKEGQLRGNFAQNIAARNAGLQQQSFESAAQRGLQATGIGAQREQFFAGLPFQEAQLQQQAALGLQSGALQQSGLLAQLLQANQGATNQAGQFNATAQNQAGQFNAGQTTQAGQFNSMQGQQWNSFLQSVLGQASGMQQGQQGMNAQLLAIMAGLPGMNAPQQQPSAIPGAFGDISQLLMFLPFLQGLNKPKTG